eukprot:6178007-Pleurochrysis_carterae.AAC.1
MPVVRAGDYSRATAGCLLQHVASHMSSAFAVGGGGGNDQFAFAPSEDAADSVSVLTKFSSLSEVQSASKTPCRQSRDLSRGGEKPS